MPPWKKESEPVKPILVIPERRKEPIVKYKVFICEFDQLEQELNERQDIGEVLFLERFGSAVKVVVKVANA